MADCLTNLAINAAFGGHWNAINETLVGLSQLGIMVPVGLKYKKSEC